METTHMPADAGPAGRSFVKNATLIGAITLGSRVLGMARESIAANYFGAGAVYSAFTFAFTIPNLFRKLLGEGALSAAFIPLYAQAVKRKDAGSGEDPNAFAAASVNLLCAILVGITIGGELALGIVGLFVSRPDYVLAVKLTAIMLPYVLLVCGGAFLGGILQVHHRFAATTATAVVSNVCLIVAMIAAARTFDLTTETGRERGVVWLAVSVLVAGVLQIGVLLPSLRAAGFRFRLIFNVWTPAIRKMLKLSIPVALGAGVLQVGVVLDKGIAFMLAATEGVTHFSLLGYLVPYPLREGAAARLNWAQFMYQFPLGVFAIALATAIFPKLSGDAIHADGKGLPGTVPDEFKTVLRQGIEAALFIGLPASVGMIVVRYPAVRLLFERGNFTASDTYWVALSTAIYSAAIWAFSMQQILNRAYYALHDAATPLVWTIVNLLINLAVEIPLLWTGLGEAAMAVGTLVSFTIQSIVMLWMLDRRVGGLGLGRIAPAVVKMVAASLLMWGVCIAVQYVPAWPRGEGKVYWAFQLAALIALGGATYFCACGLLGINMLKKLPRRRS